MEPGTIVGVQIVSSRGTVREEGRTLSKPYWWSKAQRQRYRIGHRISQIQDTNLDRQLGGGPRTLQAEVQQV